ncbi:MAG: hypothetical protein KAX76_01410 [Comamonas sp.]|jgi:hypothetical protein|nr:hypothetical protein [Comamonas sp.]
MFKKNAGSLAPPKPSAQAVRRAVASSTALETGQSIQQLEQQLQNRQPQRFAHIKLAAA